LITVVIGLSLIVLILSSSGYYRTLGIDDGEAFRGGKHRGIATIAGACG
jgi:hypothetical protein